MKACFGSTSFCESVFSANALPIADAGDDQEVEASETVTLDGSESRDPDGRIDSFSWVQTAGQSVTLREADSPRAAFDAPEVDAETVLVFQLTVVDDLQAADHDSVTVRVLPEGALAVQAGIDWISDTLPPGPLTVARPCDDAARPTGQAWFAYAGAWLTVMGESMGDGYDGDDVTSYLDAARALLARATQGDVPGESTHVLAASLWQQGLETLYRFTIDRDPALAEWAAGMRKSGLHTGMLAGVHDGTKTLRLVRPAEPVLLDHMASQDADIRYLIGLTCAGNPDPLEVAAALMRMQTTRSQPEKITTER